RHTRFSRDWSSDVCSSDLRTFGEAEYAVYLYALTRKDFTVKYDITKQKDLFKQALEQIVTDRLENTFDIHETEKPELKKELFTRSEERRVGKEYRSECKS